MARASRGCPRVLITSAVLIAGITGGLLSGAPSYASPVSPFHSVTHHAAAQPEQAARFSDPDQAGLETLTGTGSLTGTVLGAAGTPLPGACVTASGPSAERTVIAARTSGRYAITGLRPGTYTISFADCASEADYLRQWYGGSYTAGGAAHVRVLPGLPVRLNPVSLRPVSPEVAIAAERRALGQSSRTSQATATIAGTVVGQKGQHLRGMCAIAWIRTRFGLTEEAVATLRRGAYELALAITGRHVDKITMQFTSGCGSAANYGPQWWKYTAAEAKATTLSVRSGTHLTGIDARLSAGGVIAGTVRADSAHGQPLAGICVQAIAGGQTTQIGSARTAANGSYRITALGTDRYLVAFSPGCGSEANYLTRSYQPVRVTAGKTTRLSVFLHPGGTISGTVTSAASGSKPVRGICVTAASSAYASTSTRTAANGSYSMQQLPPGRYLVSFAGGCGNRGSDAPQYYPSQPSSEAATKIHIGYGQTVTGVDASMAPGATITGKVTNSAGHDLSGVCPSLLTPQQLGAIGPGTYAIPGGGPIFPTSARGTYRITNLAPGLYYVLFSTCLGTVNVAPVWYPAASQFTGATAVSADGSTVTTGIDAVMRTGGTITGTILGRDGRPVPGACPIVANPAAPGLLSTAFSVLSGPDPNGRYKLTGLASGSYRVETVLCYGGHYASQWFRDQDSEGSASPVSVRAGHVTAGIDFRLHAGGSVSGRVTSSAGRPLARVCVLLGTSHGQQLVGITSPTGRYVLTEQPAGVYTVTFAYCLTVSPSLAPAEKTGVRISATHPVRGLNAVMRPGASITGTVLGGVEGGGPPAPAAGVCVEATPKTGRGIVTAAVTNASGHYDLGNLAAGKYGLLVTDYCNGGAPLPLAPLRVSRLIPAGRSGATPVSVTLQADGQITGSVDGPGSGPLAGICVTAQPAGVGTPVVAVTTSTGSYVIGSLVPWSYRVKFSSGCGTTGYRTKWFNNARSAAKATPVEVDPGEPTNGISAVLTT